MALDIYVMPIWKFRARAYTTPLEAAGFPGAMVIRPDGVFKSTGPAVPGFFARQKAKAAVRRFRRQVEAEAGKPVLWKDEGDCVYAKQGFFIGELQTYAKWLDYQDLLPMFVPPEHRRHFEHPVWLPGLDRPLTFPQLVTHSCIDGCFLPAEFEYIAFVEPHWLPDGNVARRPVGSCFRLAKELKSLAARLGVTEDQQWGYKSDPLAGVKAGLSQMLTITRLSCERGLPIIFDG